MMTEARIIHISLAQNTDKTFVICRRTAHGSCKEVVPTHANNFLGNGKDTQCLGAAPIDVAREKRLLELKLGSQSPRSPGKGRPD